MKAFLFTCLSFFLQIVAFAATAPAEVKTFSSDIDKPTFNIDTSKLFPSPSKVETGNGVMNIVDYIKSLIPLLVILMGTGAVLMVIYGGFMMVLGGASAEQSEKGKGIIKDALIGLVLGLLAYVIIATIWTLLNFWK